MRIAVLGVLNLQGCRTAAKKAVGRPNMDRKLEDAKPAKLKCRAPDKSYALQNKPKTGKWEVGGRLKLL